MKITLGNTLPPYPDFVEGIRRTPDRGYTLVPVQAKLSLAVTSTKGGETMRVKVRSV